MLPPGAGVEWGRAESLLWTAASLDLGEGGDWSAGSDLDHPSGNYRYDEPTDTWMRVTRSSPSPSPSVPRSPHPPRPGFPRIKRSDDGGETWRGEYRAGSNRVLYAVPLSLPVSGGLTSPTSGGGGTEGLAYSLDRGRRSHRGPTKRSRDRRHPGVDGAGGDPGGPRGAALRRASMASRSPMTGAGRGGRAGSGSSSAMAS